MSVELLTLPKVETAGKSELKDSLTISITKEGGVEVNGRLGLLYSNKDYASEWGYHYQNKRFVSIDNTRFGVNVIVYALTR